VSTTQRRRPEELPDAAFDPMTYEQHFLLSLTVTECVEIPIVALLVKRFYKYSEIRLLRIVAVAFVASALTLPYLWFVLPAFITNGAVYILGGEFLIIAAEAVIYNRLLGLKPREAAVASLAANVSSALLGSALQYTFGPNPYS